MLLDAGPSRRTDREPEDLEAPTRANDRVLAGARSSRSPGCRRICVLLTLEVGRTRALARLDDEAQVGGLRVRDVELPQDQVRCDRPRRIAGKALAGLVYTFV